MLQILARNLSRTSCIRLASTLSKIEKCFEDDMPDSSAITLTQMKKSIRQRCPTQQSYSIKLKQKLNCPPEIIPWKDLAQLKETPLAHGIERLQFLCDIGANHNTIVKIIGVLKKPLDQLRTESAILESLQPRHLNDLLPLLTLPTKEFNKTIARLRQDGIDGNRIYCMSELLDIEPADMAVLYAKYNKTLNLISVAMLKERIETFLSYGLTPEELRRNLSVFARSVGRITRRFSRIKQVYQGDLKPWMAHCKDTIIDKHIRNHVQRQALLNPNEFYPEFLARKLKVDPIFVKGLIQKRPKILLKNIKTLSDKLDYLLDECKFTAHQIISCPHIIFFNLATTKRRIAEYRDHYNCMPTNLTVIAQSESKFRNHIAKVLRRREADQSL